MILARITSQYGDVYFLAIDSSVCRSSLERFMLNGLFLGIRDTIPLMQAYQITSSIRLIRYVIVFPNNCTKLACPFPNHFVRILVFPDSEKGWLTETVIPRPLVES